MIDATLALAERDGLPDALRVLVTEIPRETWEAHPEFGGVVQFWLGRHLMFREVLAKMKAGTEAVLDRQLTPEENAPHLSRYGGFFLNELHGHHHIEDEHYFPKLIKLDSRLERGFAILDADHHALDAWLNRFSKGANAVLNSEGDAAREATATFHTDLIQLERLLNRHLCDEEEIIAPVILKSGFRG